MIKAWRWWFWRKKGNGLKCSFVLWHCSGESDSSDAPAHVSNFNGTLVRLSSPGNTLSSDSVSSRVSVHLHKCQLSEICSRADALGWEVQSTCSGLASHHWLVRAEGSHELKTQYRKMRSVRSWGTSVLYHIEVSLFCFISLCWCKSVFLARSYCVL